VQLGINLGYAGSERFDSRHNVEVVREADRLGYAVAWVGEAYGSDAASVVTWLGAHTSRIDVGSAVFQIPARTPAMAAMTAASIDTLTSGRFRLGLGVSGPQVSEGWHGVPFKGPLGRTREYVEGVRSLLRGERLTMSGMYYRVPADGAQAKPLKLTTSVLRSTLPIYLAAMGPRNLELAGEEFDGWLATFYSPEQALDQHEAWRKGWQARQDPARRGEAFDVVPTVPVVVGNDIGQCADRVRPYCALYLGGMGSRTLNYYNQQAHRMGFGKAAQAVQDCYLGGDHAGAAALVPTEFVDAIALLGPVDRIADRLVAFAESGVTTLSVAVQGGLLDDRLGTVRSVADALDRSGLGE
jgi:F420-dependent oxidoreductase-like protein